MRLSYPRERSGPRRTRSVSTPVPFLPTEIKIGNRVSGETGGTSLPVTSWHDDWPSA